MSICPEGEFRANLSDQEFWTYVLDIGGSPEGPEEPPDIDMLEPGKENFRLDNPCTVCRSPGACYYDSEGRPMIHIEESEDE